VAYDENLYTCLNFLDDLYVTILSEASELGSAIKGFIGVRALSWWSGDVPTMLIPKPPVDNLLFQDLF
jgi:hypothetical protein